MCLFNRDVQGMTCGHEECKNFYMLNKQMCMYGHNQSAPANPLTQVQNILQKTQSQPILPTAQKPSASFTAPQEINSKRPRLSLNDLVSKDSEPSPSTKLIKSGSGDKPEGTIQMPGAETQRNQSRMPEANQFAGSASNMNNNGDMNLFNTLLMNNLLLQNSQNAAANQKPDLNTQMMNNPNLLFSLLQNPQANMTINPHYQAMAGPQQPNLNSMAFSQFLPQTTGAKQGLMGTQGLMGNELGFGDNQETLGSNNMNAGSGTGANAFNDGNVKNESGSTAENIIKEFQGRIMGLLCQQNKMLVDLKEKNNVLQDTLACLIGEVNTIKDHTKHLGQNQTTPRATNALRHTQLIATNNESISVEELLTFLYGANKDFQYQLVLKSDLALPLYRERNFKFTVLLTDKNGNPIENSNRIPLTLGIYSSENPPKYIDANTAGNKILKGFIEKDLVNGSVTFDKIQIKEVTSHFRNGWVFFVVYPKVTTSNPTSLLMNPGNVVDAQKIRPLILEKVVVKAKKAKEKEQTASEANDPEENQDEEA